MTILYKPVPIETVEQANALPDGTVIFDGDPADGDTYYYDRASDDWYVDGHPGLMSIAVECGCTVTALVPIEAEEEGRSMYTDPDTGEVRHDVFPDRRADGSAIHTHTRYVTPWAEA